MYFYFVRCLGTFACDILSLSISLSLSLRPNKNIKNRKKKRRLGVRERRFFPPVQMNPVMFWPLNKLGPFWTYLLNWKTSGLSSEATANREILIFRPLMTNFSLLHISIFRFSGSGVFNVRRFRTMGTKLRPK